MFVTDTSIFSQNGRFGLFQCGDLHADLKAFNLDHFLKWRSQVIDYVERGNTAIVVCAGDYIHGRLPKDKHFKANVLRPDVLENLDNYAGYMTRQISHLLSPLVRDGIQLYMLKGNHDMYVKDFDLPEEVAANIGATYGGVEMMLRVQAVDQHDKSRTTIIYAAHGAGGGTSPAGKLNHAKNSIHIAEADAYLFGHIHDQVHRVEQRYHLKAKGSVKLCTKEILYSYASSFVDSRMEGVHDYPGEKSLPSVNPGKYMFTVDTWNDLFFPSRVL